MRHNVDLGSTVGCSNTYLIFWSSYATSDCICSEPWSILLEHLTRNRVIVHLTAIALALISYVNSSELYGLVTVSVFVLLTFIMRPWVIFDALDHPTRIPAEQSHHDPGDMVVGVTIEGEAVAYPMSDMVVPRHLVHDTIAEIPVLVSFCAACNSAIVYKSMVIGEKTTFQVMGVWRRNLVMRDLLTNSIWQQSTGEAIYGEMTGSQLEFIGGVLMTWEGWVSENPNTLIAVEPQKNTFRRHQMEVLKKMLNVAHIYHVPGFTDLGNELLPHEVGVSVNGTTKAYPLSLLEQKTEIEDSIGSIDLAISYDPSTDKVSVTKVRQDDRVSYPYERHWWMGWKEFNPNTLIYSK